VSLAPLRTVLTRRMVCEALVPAHAPELSVLLRDPRVARTLFPDGRSPSEAEIEDGLGQKARHWEEHGFGLWLLRDRGSGAMVGRGGLQHTGATGEDEVEIGWAIVPERWGQGLATELAEASIETGFEDLGLDGVIAFTLPDNVASRRVMEKTGFRYEREFVHEWLPHVLYRRTRC
jgi:ribosomal-protein-alanine N-acetyltransferase